MIDNRAMYAGVPWCQSRLLNTTVTKRWTDDERALVDAQERRRAKVYFTAEDDGRGAGLVYVYKTAEECAEAVANHNSGLPVF